ncbi:hypothetical protein C8Q78DRAFT_371515 [Trametes maxima]|nr:hypothetical protein C8Q78DRAFT_371515 [Trametes maxima]
MTSLETRFAEVWILCMDDHPNTISDLDADQELRRLRRQRAFEGELVAEDDPSMAKIYEALRELAGCRTQGRMREEAALFHLDPLLLPIVTPLHLAGPFNTWEFKPPPVYTAYAHSIAAYAYLQKYYIETEEDLDILKGDALLFSRLNAQVCTDDPVDNIYRAAVHARDAAALLFITPIVLKVGLVFRDLLCQLRINPEAYKHFRPLWRALERRACEVIGYVWYGAVIGGYDGITPWEQCMGPKCNAVPSASQPLVPCKGGCPACVKPRYCSPRCARHDWRRHSMICKSFPCEPLSILDLDEAAYDAILQRLTNDGTARGFELVDADEIMDEWRDGWVHWVKADTASPYASGRRVRWIGRRYD